MIGMVMEPIPALAVIPIEVVGPPTVIAAVGKVILMVDDDGGEVDIIFGSYDAEALEGDDPGVDVDGYMYRDVDAKG